MAINKVKIDEFFKYKNITEWVSKNKNGGNNILSDIEFSFLDILAEIQFLNPELFPEKEKHITAFESQKLYEYFINQVILQKNN